MPQASVQLLAVVPMRWDRVFICATQPSRSPPERVYATPMAASLALRVSMAYMASR